MAEHWPLLKNGPRRKKWASLHRENRRSKKAVTKATIKKVAKKPTTKKTPSKVAKAKPSPIRDDTRGIEPIILRHRYLVRLPYKIDGTNTIEAPITKKTMAGRGWSYRVKLPGRDVFNRSNYVCVFIEDILKYVGPPLPKQQWPVGFQERFPTLTD